MRSAVSLVFRRGGELIKVPNHKKSLLFLTIFFMVVFCFSYPTYASNSEDFSYKKKFPINLEVVFKFKIRTPWFECEKVVSIGDSQSDAVEKSKNEEIEERKTKEVAQRIRTQALSIIDTVERARDPEGILLEGFESFACLGYAHEYVSSSDVYVIKEVVKSCDSSPFTEKDVILNMQNVDDDIVFISEESIKEHILEALRRVKEGGEFYSSEDPRMFTIANVPSDIFNNFKKTMTTFPVPLEGEFVSKDQVVADVESLLREIGEGVQEQNFAWLFFFFGNSQGAYEVCLQEIQTETFSMERFLSGRIYVSPGFVRISKRDAEAFLEERFSRETKLPCVLESNEEDLFELDFKLLQFPEFLREEARLDEFAREIAEGLIEASRID